MICRTDNEERSIVAEIINHCFETKVSVDDVVDLKITYLNRRVFATFKEGETTATVWFMRDWFRQQVKAAVNNQPLASLPCDSCIAGRCRAFLKK